ncbi:MAG: helix-turn-helix transcriptional regulator [Comamonadaceae bacterium]|jgi:DNA-binding CsgD family transcriptional regulator|nr:helix-turn-helix transcriptional regulator [Comamonadaceae bacterium]
MISSPETLAAALLELYEGSQKKHITVFPRYALEIIKKFIDFDAALIGLAKIDDDGQMSARFAFNYEEDAQINDEYMSIANRDPVTKTIFDNPGKALNFDVTKFIKLHDVGDINDYVQRWQHMHILAIAVPYCPKHGNLGISLRRADAKWAYLPVDTHTLEVLIPHVRESFRINRALFTQQVELISAEPIGGFCIFDTSGVIVFHDNSFEHCMRDAFPEYEGFKIPHRLLQTFLDKQQHIQTIGHLLMQASWVGLFCFLSVRPSNKIDVLTPREQAVAQFYGTGLTYKEIGQELSISPATVRRHIEATYRKLNVKNKADLAFLVQAHGNTKLSEKLLANLVPENLQ